MLEVRPCTVAEFFSAPNIDALLDEYAQESCIDGLPGHNPVQDTYRLLQDAGALKLICAYMADELVGFIFVLTSVNPHYAVNLSAIESYFVASTHRSSGAGLRLLREAEKLAAEQGAAAILVSAPTGGRLAEVMPRVGYRETNRIFFRGLHV
jgi:GNAT superfamily N-acetyltransferase